MRCPHCGHRIDVDDNKENVVIGLSPRLSSQVDKLLSHLSLEKVNTAELDTAIENMNKEKGELETAVKDNKP